MCSEHQNSQNLILNILAPAHLGSETLRRNVQERLEINVFVPFSSDAGSVSDADDGDNVEWLVRKASVATEPLGPLFDSILLDQWVQSVGHVGVALFNKDLRQLREVVGHFGEQLLQKITLFAPFNLE